MMWFLLHNEIIGELWVKDGVGKVDPRENNPALASQLLACWTYVKRVRGLADVIGEEDLSVVLLIKRSDKQTRHLVLPGRHGWTTSIIH